MYCVIQKIERAKQNTYGEPLRIEPYETHFTMNGIKYVTYGYSMSSERFERPIRTAYKISIHKSYRENGKVKKRQVSICTMGYYDIVDTSSWGKDYMISHEWEEKQQLLGLTEEELINLIYNKLDPLIEKIENEFKQSEEGKLKQEHQKILSAYSKAQEEFVRKYECDSQEFKNCYDIFLNLRNPKYLKKVQEEYQSRKQYEKFSHSYSEHSYKSYNKGGYSNNFSSNHNQDNKEVLRQFYRELSKKFHPDANPTVDTSEQMKVLNQLKQEWGL